MGFMDAILGKKKETEEEEKARLAKEKKFVEKVVSVGNFFSDVSDAATKDQERDKDAGDDIIDGIGAIFRDLWR